MKNICWPHISRHLRLISRSTEVSYARLPNTSKTLRSASGMCACVSLCFQPSSFQGFEYLGFLNNFSILLVCACSSCNFQASWAAVTCTYYSLLLFYCEFLPLPSLSSSSLSPAVNLILLVSARVRAPSVYENCCY